LIILAATTSKLQIVLGGSVGTQLPVVACYGDHTSSTYTPGAGTTQSNDTTAVDIVAAPAASTQRQVKFLSVYNPNGSAVTVTVRYNDNATVRTLWTGSLAAGDSLFFLDTIGFYVLDSSGQIKGTGSGGGASPTTTKGDLEVYNGTVIDRLGVGTLLQGILADSAESVGIRWGDVVSVIDRDAASLEIVSSTSETSIYSFSVPANTLRTDRSLRVRIVGSLLNNTGSGQQFTVRIKLGSTTLYADASPAVPTSATRYGFDFNIILTNQESEAIQTLGGFLYMGNQGATTGIGDMGTDETPAHTAIGGSATEDTTTNLTFDVTIQLGASSANLSWKKESAIMEVL